MKLLVTRVGLMLVRLSLEALEERTAVWELVVDRRSHRERRVLLVCGQTSLLLHHF